MAGGLDIPSPSCYKLIDSHPKETLMSILDDLIMPALQKAGKQPLRQEDTVAYGREMMGRPLLVIFTDMRDGLFLHLTIDPSLSIPADKPALLEALLGLDYTAGALTIGRDPRDGEIILHTVLPIWYGQPSEDGLIDFLQALEWETERYLTILLEVASGKPPTIVFDVDPTDPPRKKKPGRPRKTKK
jgi:hypothetical protein